MLSDVEPVRCVPGAPKADTVVRVAAYVTSCTGDVGGNASRTEGYRPKSGMTAG